MGSNSDLTLKDLTLKNVVLVALTSQRRVQKIVSLTRPEYIQDREWCEFAIISYLNQQKPGRGSDIF